MIEIIYNDRCIKCGVCAKVCPNDVFDFKPGSNPTIARQADCVTCFICEAFCEPNALYVHPISTPTPDLDPEHVLASGVVGSYRRALGWETSKPGSAGVEPPDFGDPHVPFPIEIAMREAAMRDAAAREAGE